MDGGSGRKERDWSQGRAIEVLSEDEEDDDMRGRKKGEEDEDYEPASRREDILELSRAARETARRALRRTEGSPPPTKPCVVAVAALEGSNRIRLASPGLKRGREEEEDERMETEEGVWEGEEREEDWKSGHPSRDSSAARQLGPSSSSEPHKGPSTKRRKRGRPAVYPGYEGQYTAVKIRERAKVRERDLIEEKEGEILDPEVKAMTARAESVERNALKILDDLRQVPTSEFTDLGLRAVEAIKKVASFSRNMKRAFVGVLWRAAESLTALNLAYTTRLREKERGNGGEKWCAELEKFRSELSALRTENALIVGVNKNLPGQIAELRLRVAQVGDDSPPGPPESRRKKVRRGRGHKRYDLSDTYSSSDREVEVALERELSPGARLEGIWTRNQVREDLEKGALPPAIRPALRGRTKGLDGEPGGGETPHHRPHRPGHLHTPSRRPRGGGDLRRRK